MIYRDRIRMLRHDRNLDELLTLSKQIEQELGTVHNAWEVPYSKGLEISIWEWSVRQQELEKTRKALLEDLRECSRAIQALRVTGAPSA